MTRETYTIVRRLILSLLTILAVFNLFASLTGSLAQPQIQSRLELYQTNIVLEALEFQGDRNSSSLQDNINFTNAIEAVAGDKPYLSAQKQYQKAKQEAQSNLANLQTQLKQLSSIQSSQATNNVVLQELQSSIDSISVFINELDLKIGILQAQQNQVEDALKSWSNLITKDESQLINHKFTNTALILKDLWSKSPQFSSTTESQIENSLDGWFRFHSLKKLYELQNRQDTLSQLENRQQAIALNSFWKLIIISFLPIFGGVVGFSLLIFLGIQWLVKKDKSLLLSNYNKLWNIPWNWEITWQVIIVGFFFFGQILLPLILGLININPVNFDLRSKAIYVLISYLLMSAGCLSILYFSLKPFFPLPKEWFKLKFFDNWFVWGFGGYLVAVPLVVIVSLLNEKIWQGQGGSNPLLFLALQAQDKVALAIFFTTASIAAPIFEETIFRGFLLPSLTRYISINNAILLSASIFAIAHLSFSEILPLTTLGIVLGFVYTRSRNILAPMLLHCLWNSGTLLTLFVLGSGSN